jgi:hypothetical protein
MRAAQDFNGQCLCGAVRFQVTPPTRWCLHCHCTLCRKAHGAPFVTWFGIGKDQLNITRGESELRWRDSSDHGRRAFCRVCGSQLFFVSSRWPGQIDVVRALVDGPIDRAPSAHVYVSSKADWLEIRDGLDCYPEEYQSARSRQS